jgi:MFS family permease
MMGSIFYAYQFILRVMPNIMLDDIMQQFHIDAAVFGQYSGVYYIGYCLMHLPIGIMMDRYGTKNVMPCYCSGTHTNPICRELGLSYSWARPGWDGLFCSDFGDIQDHS